MSNIQDATWEIFYLMRIVLAKKMNQVLALGSGIKLTRVCIALTIICGARHFKLATLASSKYLLIVVDLGKGLFGSGQRHFSVKTPIIQDTEKSSRSQQERKSEIVVDKSAKEAATQAELLILFM